MDEACVEIMIFEWACMLDEKEQESRLTIRNVSQWTDW